MIKLSRSIRTCKKSFTLERFLNTELGAQVPESQPMLVFVCGLRPSRLSCAIHRRGGNNRDDKRLTCLGLQGRGFSVGRILGLCCDLSSQLFELCEVPARAITSAATGGNTVMCIVCPYPSPAICLSHSLFKVEISLRIWLHVTPPCSGAVVRTSCASAWEYRSVLLLPFLSLAER